MILLTHYHDHMHLDPLIPLTLSYSDVIDSCNDPFNFIDPSPAMIPLILLTTAMIPLILLTSMIPYSTQCIIHTHNTIIVEKEL